MKAMRTKFEKRAALLSRAKKIAKANGITEFKCPNCGGIASTVLMNGEVRTECHGLCQISAYMRIEEKL